MPWLLKILINPIDALDLRDERDQPDHGKIMGFFAFLILFVLIAGYVFAGARLVPLGHMIVLGTLAFGWPAWRTFLKARTVTSTESISGGDMYRDDERGSSLEREPVNPNVPVGFKF